MKQPEDNRTAELNLVSAETKRGRGRPAKDNALTPAQRAKRYRDAKRAAGVPRAPANQHEAKFELDYTRPTWEEHDEALEKLRDQVLKLEAENAQLKGDKEANAGPWPAHRHQLEQWLQSQEKEITSLRKDQALLIAERAAAFKAAEEAKAELAKATTANRAISLQATGLTKKMYEMEAKLKKRDASRKKKEQATGTDA